MSQVGRSIKNLEAPRPLKSSNRQSHHTSLYELQTIEELITLIENVADSVSIGQCNPDSMSILLSNLRVHGPQLEEYSKSTLDQAYVKFRNASQDERLSIITRMNLLELIELRAKSWQISNDINTYYKHKASDVQPDNNSATANDVTLLDTSPTATALAQTVLSPGEVIRTSGKFPKPTKIPGKNYSKDEIIIRNADSGKVMGIKGRRVHMIEELSETIISFQRVNPGAKERLVQITGPNEEKINCAKQLIEETIRRNASPVRLDETVPSGGAGSCSSLASSASDEALPRANRNSLPSFIPSGVNQAATGQSTYTASNQSNHFVTSGGHGHVGKSRNNTGTSGQILLHSLSTNDASLGEYKYTVNVGQHSIKITGDCFDLVRVAKLVLDEYFSSGDFLSAVEAGAMDSNLMNSSSTTSMSGTALSTPTSIIPPSHQLVSASPFVDSGIGLNVMASSQFSQLNSSVDAEDDVFIIDDDDSPASNSSNTITNPPPNGLTRSRRSHFSHGDNSQETNKDGSSAKTQGLEVRIVYENDRLLYFSKSPHSWAVPRDWIKICETYPNIIRNKDLDNESNRFDADKYLQEVKAGSTRLASPQLSGTMDDSKSETPSDPE